MTGIAQLHRIGETDRMPVTFTVDGIPVNALAGDTVLTAVLASRVRLRDNEFDGSPRAGFCMLGACQECWVWLADGRRLRACSTPIVDGLAILTTSPLVLWQIQS